MKEFKILKNDSGQRLNKFLQKAVPRLPGGMMHKYCRLKRIKVNGKRTEPACRLEEGDVLSLYISDEFFETENTQEAFHLIQKPNLKIIYEDTHILLVDKAPGMVVHADDRGTADTLIAHIQSYLYKSGQWNPADENSFVPALCNRIDRNTGGIVIAAKTAPALRIMNDKIKNHEIDKTYLCIVHGKPAPASGVIENFMRKDEALGRMAVYKSRVPGSKTAVTHYETLVSKDKLSLVSCRLITGRTHQIRAHMAFIGCPLLGDGKYGTNEQNRPYRETKQALYSYKLHFAFQGASGELSYLAGKTFSVKQVPFADKYFPDYTYQ